MTITILVYAKLYTFNGEAHDLEPATQPLRGGILGFLLKDIFDGVFADNPCRMEVTLAINYDGTDSKKYSGGGGCRKREKHELTSD